MIADYPRLREHHTCKLCGDSKDANTVVCWHCYYYFNMRHGNAEITAHLDGLEADITLGRIINRAMRDGGTT